MKTRVSLRYFVSYCSLVLVEQPVGFSTNNAWTLPLAIHSWHVAIKPLRWWRWVHWIVFMTSLYILRSLLCACWVLCVHTPISVLIIIYIFNDYNIYVYKTNETSNNNHDMYLVHRHKFNFTLSWWISFANVFNICCCGHKKVKKWPKKSYHALLPATYTQQNIQ